MLGGIVGGDQQRIDDAFGSERDGFEIDVMVAQPTAFEIGEDRCGQGRAKRGERVGVAVMAGAEGFEQVAMVQRAEPVQLHAVLGPVVGLFLRVVGVGGAHHQRHGAKRQCRVRSVKAAQHLEPGEGIERGVRSGAGGDQAAIAKHVE